MLRGDARSLLSQVDEGSVDCIITSPPYWTLKKYGDERAGQIGFGQSYEEYLGAVEEVFSASFRAVRPQGVLWVVSDTLREHSEGGGELMPLPVHLADRARKAGWRLQDMIIWRKNKTLPWSGSGKLRNLIEYICFFTKAQAFKHRPYRVAERHLPSARWVIGWPERYHPLGRAPANIWDIDIPTQGIWSHTRHLHFCPFPQELVARMVALTTDEGDTVLDPFAGVGTVPAQAAVMGRVGRGIELNESYAEYFRQRVLPSFAREWLQSERYRELEYRDQTTEAVEILKLRCLKAGKELLRAFDRIAQSVVGDDPVRGVETIVVLAPTNLTTYIDAPAGTVGRIPIHLVVAGYFEDGDRRRVEAVAKTVLERKPLTKFGLDFELEVIHSRFFSDQLSSHALFEYSHSARQAYTRASEEALFAVRPRLLTNLQLARPYVAQAADVLEATRSLAEREMLQAELAQAGGLEKLADRLALPLEHVARLLEQHGLVQRRDPVAVPLPLVSASESGDDW